MCRYYSKIVQRNLRAVQALVGNEFAGLSNQELAAKIDCSAAECTAVIANLTAAGWCEPVPTNPKRVRLTKFFVQLSNTVAASINQQQQQLQFLSQQYGGLLDVDKQG